MYVLNNLSLNLLFALSDLFEYNQHIKKQVDRNLIETNREDVERRHLSNELNSLNDNRLLLRQKLALIQEHHKQLELNLERETKKRKDMKDKYDHQIDNLRVSVQEYVR
jgi:chromosome segregation ATPase